MQISSETGPGEVWVHLQAETEEESVFLIQYFKTDLKKLAKKFPLKDKTFHGFHSSPVPPSQR